MTAPEHRAPRTTFMYKINDRARNFFLIEITITKVVFLKLILCSKYNDILYKINSQTEALCGPILSKVLGDRELL
jgi:hypothetical protein